MSTDETLFNSDDPRLTAYALGELSDPAERAQVEQLLAASPEARTELADIRNLTAELTAEYEQERLAVETTPANMVALPRLRPFSFGPWLKVAALFLIVGLAVGIALPVYHSAQVRSRKPPVAVSSEKVPAYAAHAMSSRLNAPAPAASASLLADDKDQQPTIEAEVRKLVVPPGQPLPTSLPPGTTAVYGPPAISGVVGGNPLALGASVEDNSLLFARNKKASPPFISDKNTAAASPSGADGAQGRDAQLRAPLIAAAAPPAPPSSAPGSSATTFTGTKAVAAGTLTLDRVVPTPMADQPPAPARAKAPGATSSRLLAQTRSATRRDAADRIVVTGGNIPTSEEVGISPVDTVDQATRDRTGQKDRLNVLKRSPAGIPSDGGQIAAAPVSPVETAPMLGDVPITGRLFKDQAEQLRANTAEYTHLVENSFLAAKENPLSTFSIDVDTASYAIVRRFIDAGSLPPPDAVRVEEMLNYFPYADAPPAPESDQPFAIHLEGAACPWNTAHRLVRVGIKAREMANDKRPPSNIVFLLDVSGSMMPEERLPLIKKSLRLLVDQLREDDHVAIVVYAGESGLALPPTSGDHQETILRAIENLHAGGSTNGASGIKLAYNVARKGFIQGGTNRVILATDGDFNVGVTSHGDLLRLIERESKDGVFLSVLGVGTDNLKDSTMQTLADHGNGNYHYIDRLEEARKVLVDQMSGTLVTVAKDVKIQVEFNPAVVASYRLIGYEKRLLRKEDFNDDKIDAGEIGAGHHVTALYEIVPVGQPGGEGTVDPLKYQPAPVVTDAAAPRTHQTATPEMLTVKMRHKAPDSDRSERSYEESLVDHGAPGDYGNASADFRFAAAVASFGMILRDSPHRGDATLGSALELAQAGKGEDPNGYRAGFIELVRQARALQQGER